MYFYLIIIAAVVIDLATKIAVRMHVELGERTEILGGFVQILHLANTGATGNLFHGWGRVLAALAVVMAAVAIYLRQRGKIRGTYLQVCVALIVGGALGNVIDRIVYNQVTDFLYFSEQTTMNFADAWVFTGILLILGRQIVQLFRPAAPAQAAAAPDKDG